VREETGLEIEVGDPVFVGEWFPVIHGQAHHIVALFLSCKATSKTVRLSEEHDDYQWVNPDTLDDFDVMGPEPEAVQAWVRQSIKK
jgi:8-oxo-dGTP pyrophosphatase MutT (NUDIX family)